jgi:hypothetical protein
MFLLLDTGILCCCIQAYFAVVYRHTLLLDAGILCCWMQAYFAVVYRHTLQCRVAWNLTYVTYDWSVGAGRPIRTDHLRTLTYDWSVGAGRLIRTDHLRTSGGEQVSGFYIFWTISSSKNHSTCHAVTYALHEDLCTFLCVPLARNLCVTCRICRNEKWPNRSCVSKWNKRLVLSTSFPLVLLRRTLAYGVTPDLNSGVSNLGLTPTILTEVFHGFPPSLQANSGTAP